MADGSLREKTFSSLIWKFLERMGYQAIQIVIQVVLARLLGPDDFGVLAIMIVFVNVGNVFVQSGLNTALVQSVEATDRDFSTVFWMSLSIALLVYGGIFWAAPAVAAFYAMPTLVWSLRALCLILLINAYNATQVAHIQRSLEFRKIFNATLTSVVVSGVVGVGVALSGGGVWALVSQQLSYQITNCLMLAAQVRWRPRPVFDPARARELFSFGWKLLVSGLLETGYQSLSDLIVGKQFTQGELGIFSQGKKYPQAVGSILDGAVQPVMLSVISHVQQDAQSVKALTRRAIRVSTFGIVPAMLCFALVARPLVTLLLGEQWLPSVPFLQIYCVVYAFLPVHSTNLQALNGTGHSADFLRLELIKKAYGVVILLVAALVFKDLYAIALGSLLGSLVSTAVNAWPNRRLIGYGFAEQARDFSPAFVLSAVAAAVAWPISLAGLHPALTIVCQVLVMAAAYLGVARLVHLETLDYLLAQARGWLRAHRRSQ